MLCARLMLLKSSTLYPCAFSSTAPMAKMTPVTDKIRSNSDETRAKAKCAYRQMDSVITAPYLILQNGYNPSLLYAPPIPPVLPQAPHLSHGNPVPPPPIQSAIYTLYSVSRYRFLRYVPHGRPRQSMHPSPHLFFPSLPSGTYTIPSRC